jgi:hypothetical protein
MANHNPPNQWEKGKSANPNGRPKKGQAVTDLLRETADKQALVDKLIELALDKGDIQALKYAIDRMDGKPTEIIQTQQLPDVLEVDLTEDQTNTGNAAAVESADTVQDS